MPSKKQFTTYRNPRVFLFNEKGELFETRPAPDDKEGCFTFLRKIVDSGSAFYGEIHSVFDSYRGKIRFETSYKKGWI